MQHFNYISVADCGTSKGNIHALKGMLKPEFEEASLGSAEVREVFKSSKFGTIAGCIVRGGTIKRNSKARLVRDGITSREELVRVTRD